MFEEEFEEVREGPILVVFVVALEAVGDAEYELVVVVAVAIAAAVVARAEEESEEDSVKR